MKKAQTFFFLVFLSFSLSSCLKGEKKGEKEVWRFALEEIEGSVQDAYAQQFKYLIEKRTGGEVEVKIFPYGALGTSDQITELTENGALHFAMASPGFLGKIIPEVEVFLLHFLFPRNETVLRRTLNPDSPITEIFKPLYKDKGFELLDFNPEGWMAWTANKKLTKPEDFNGLKIRVMTTPLLMASYEAYGANPTPMAYSEVYSALQLQMIDAQVNPIFAIEEMSFYEVSDYMILTDHAPFIASVVANDEFYDNLSPERKKLVNKTIRELSDYIFDFQRQYNKNRMQKIKADKPGLNIIRLTDKQREVFKKRSLKVRQNYLKQNGKKGKKILQTIRSTISEQKQQLSLTPKN